MPEPGYAGADRMNPGQVRSAIVDGLSARPAWAGIDMWRYPAGADRAEWKQGFELGEIGSIVILDASQGLAGDQFIVGYELSGAVWKAKSGALDDDYAESEAAVFALILDFWRWIQSTAGGKTLDLDTAVLDQLALPLDEVMVADQNAGVAATFTVDVAEVVTL